MKIRKYPSSARLDDVPIGRLLFGRSGGGNRPCLFMKAEHRRDGNAIDYYEVEIADLNAGPDAAPELSNAGAIEGRGLLDISETHELRPSPDFSDFTHDANALNVPGTLFISQAGLVLAVRDARGPRRRIVYLDMMSGLISLRVPDSHVAVRKWSLVTEGLEGEAVEIYTFPPAAR